MKKVIFSIAMITIALMSCNRDDESLNSEDYNSDKKSNTENREGFQTASISENFSFTISEFEDQLYNDLSGIAQNVEDAEEDFGNSDAVLQAADDYYNDVDIYSIFDSMYRVGQTMPDVEDYSSDFSPTVISRMSDIIDEVSTADEHYDAITYLENEFADVENDGQLSTDDKDALLLYISSFKTSIEFMSAYQDLLDIPFDNGSGKVAAPRWWKRWGRCVAGVVGVAISGGIAGAVGFVALELSIVRGTITGGIGGALRGAARFC